MILRVFGGLVIVLVAAACAVLEVFYLPLRAGSIRFPISILAAVVGNVVYTRTLYGISGSVLAALLPGAAWLGVIARSAIARPEGDLLMTGAPATALINLAFLGLGSLALAYAMATLRRSNRTQGAPATLGTYQSSPDRARSAQPPDTAGRR